MAISSVLVRLKLKFFSACLGDSARMGHADHPFSGEDVVLQDSASGFDHQRRSGYLVLFDREWITGFASWSMTPRVERQGNGSGAHDSVPLGGRWEEVCLG